MLKKTVFFIILVLILLSGYLLLKKDTVIFYSPHADDEVLSMGASIVHAVNQNKNVVVILLSKGLASNAFYKVNDKLESEGYGPIKLEEFGEARVNEFKKAVQALGINEENIHIYDLPDSTFSPDMVKEIMLEWELKYPGAEHHAMTYNDPHPDHAATGNALHSLKTSGKVDIGYYHIPIQEFNNIPYTGKDELLEKKHIEIYKNALDAYGEWAPKEQKYHIGQISVTDYFFSANKFLESRWHQ